MNGLLCSCCALGVLLSGCHDRDEDTVTCSNPLGVRIEIGPFGASEPVRTDLTVSGTIALDADIVVYGIALAVYGEDSSASNAVFDIPATFVPPGIWTALVPLGKLLAPAHGAGAIKIRVRASTSCDGVMDKESSSFQVAPPQDAGVDAP